jgi:radical SAM protein with 4Fe4S-binding SPASM domain
LKARGLDSIAFSLYSSRQKVHDHITNTPGSFAASVEAIRNSVRSGITTEVHFVATKINIIELDQLSDFVLTLGVRHISVLRFVPQGRGNCNSEQLIPSSQDFKILRATIAAIREKSPVSLRLGSPFNFLLLGHPAACTTGTDRMIIDAHCLAHPCDALKRVALPDRCNDAMTTPLIQIMDKDSVFRTIRNSRFPASCKSCPDLKICRGGCPAQRFLINGDKGTGRDPGCLREGFPMGIVDM